jgi:hypothetical protein
VGENILERKKLWPTVVSGGQAGVGKECPWSTYLLCTKQFIFTVLFHLHVCLLLHVWELRPRKAPGEITYSQSQGSIWVQELGFDPGFSGSNPPVLSSKSYLK